MLGQLNAYWQLAFALTPSPTNAAGRLFKEKDLLTGSVTTLNSTYNLWWDISAELFDISGPIRQAINPIVKQLRPLHS